MHFGQLATAVNGCTTATLATSFISQKLGSA
jgi:hypothetical protein